MPILTQPGVVKKQQDMIKQLAELLGPEGTQITQNIAETVAPVSSLGILPTPPIPKEAQSENQTFIQSLVALSALLPLILKGRTRTNPIVGGAKRQAQESRRINNVIRAQKELDALPGFSRNERLDFIKSLGFENNELPNNALIKDGVVDVIKGLTETPVRGDVLSEALPAFFGRPRNAMGSQLDVDIGVFNKMKESGFIKNAGPGRFVLTPKGARFAIISESEDLLR